MPKITQDTEVSAPDDADVNLAPAVVPWTPPIDPGDAGGIGNGDERSIAPDTLQETAEDYRARGGMWGPV
ncbi:hypothetical protein [Methylobacterium sp. J-068]|uniref:hypothetical protein n=1 Tax=Methylobacterium sp. J-068 TaxID=2836649 RepID=UPI001FB990AC|nr:hypothetical protein [Methylobacterium sp. J-068]MCJ2035760.1 hypothetical protein [Methylobacterium sp. J-068]